MTLEIASWNDIPPILRENFKIWSPGLSQSDYKDYIAGQLRASWSRQNLRYLVYRVGEEIAASCKAYQLDFQARNKKFSLTGIGAVYTQEKFRNQGIAKKLITGVIDQCKQKSKDGILLFSDIGTSFYASFGFERLGSTEFVIYLPKSMKAINQADENHNSNIRDCYLIEEMTKHYIRWLSSQPFGVIRSENYFKYKLDREYFLTQNSKLNWPEITITTVNTNTNNFGYAVTECSGTTLRILEIIGNQNVRQVLWQKLYKMASDRGLERIRGWESVVAYKSIRCDLNQVRSQNPFAGETMSKIHSLQRNWGQPMLLPLNKALAKWKNVFPCPLLELDHL